MRYIYISIGCISFILGGIGLVLPILPTVPFYLVSLFCFSKSSKRLETWFINSSFYKNNLKTYVETKEMSIQEKIRLLTMITLILLFSFIMMKKVLIGRIVVFIVWVVHCFYFVFKIKTKSA